MVLGFGSVPSQALLTLQAVLLKKKGTFIGEVNLTLGDQAMQEGSPSMALGLSTTPRSVVDRESQGWAQHPQGALTGSGVCGGAGIQRSGQF